MWTRCRIAPLAGDIADLRVRTPSCKITTQCGYYQDLASKAIMDSQDVKKVIRGILQKLISEYAPQKVVLFGSHVYGSPGSDSDIDLLIIKETSERFIQRWVIVQRILTGTHRSIPVETLVLTPQELENRLAIGDQFIAEILEKGEVLYATQ